MECRDCKYCYKTYYSRSIWLCCYGKDGAFSVNYTPGLIDGDIPDWCPYREKSEDKKEETK